MKTLKEYVGIASILSLMTEIESKLASLEMESEMQDLSSLTYKKYRVLKSVVDGLKQAVYVQEQNGFKPNAHEFLLSVCKVLSAVTIKEVLLICENRSNVRRNTNYFFHGSSMIAAGTAGTLAAGPIGGIAGAIAGGLISNKTRKAFGFANITPESAKLLINLYLKVFEALKSDLVDLLDGRTSIAQLTDYSTDSEHIVSYTCITLNDKKMTIRFKTSLQNEFELTNFASHMEQLFIAETLKINPAVEPITGMITLLRYLTSKHETYLKHVEEEKPPVLHAMN